MAINNTGIEMDDEQQDASESDTGIDAEAQNDVADAEKLAVDANPPAGPESTTPVNAAVETQQTEPKLAEQASPVAEDKIFTQAQHDAIIKEHDESSQKLIAFYKDQVDKYKAEADDYKERHSKSCDFARHKDSLLAQAYAQLDGSDAKLFQLITKYVQAQLDNEDKVELQARLRKVEGDLKRATSDYDRQLAKNVDLEKNNRELSISGSRLQGEVVQKDTELGQLRDELGRWHSVGDRMISAMVPQCLADKQWFLELLSELQDGIFADQPLDSSMLVFASLAELAVMERNSSAPCFEWKKQLADIGLVVANYMHQKKSAEVDVLKMLRNFSQALQDMPILKKLKIVLKVPSLGSDFNTDEVKHKNNGSSITKVLNWCIVGDGYVYCKAIVE